MIRIRLLTQQGIHPRGSEHYVYEKVPHGGYSDDPFQYVLQDRTHVRSSCAEVVTRIKKNS